MAKSKATFTLGAVVTLPDGSVWDLGLIAGARTPHEVRAAKRLKARYNKRVARIMAQQAREARGEHGC